MFNETIFFQLAIVEVIIVILATATLYLVSVFVKRPFWEPRIVPSVPLATMPTPTVSLAIVFPMEHSWSMGYLIVAKVQRLHVLAWKTLMVPFVTSVHQDSLTFPIVNVSKTFLHRYVIKMLCFDEKSRAYFCLRRKSNLNAQRKSICALYSRKGAEASCPFLENFAAAFCDQCAPRLFKGSCKWA